MAVPTTNDATSSGTESDAITLSTTDSSGNNETCWYQIRKPATFVGRSIPSPYTPGRAKGDFENLEDEMASLLGRPKTPS